MSVNSATKIPAIPQIKGLPPLAVMALQAIKETLEVREGLHEPLDRFVSVRELADLILGDEDIVNYLGSGHSHDDRYFTKTQWDLDAKGDLSVAQAAGVPGTLGVGDNNQLIRANSGAALGIEYFSPVINDFTDVDAAAPNDDDVLTYKSGTSKWEPHPGGGGPGGATDYAFRTITGITNDVVADVAHDTLTLASADNKLSIVGTAASDTITFTLNQANLDHNQTSNLTVGDVHTQYLNTTRHDTTVRHTLGTVVPHDTLNGLTDTDAAAPNDDDVLTYKSGTGKWEPHPGGGGGGATDYAFRTITGITTDVVADAAHDTLILASADNKLSIVGTAASDTITFTLNQANLDHGTIGGLGDSADHAWALLIDGTRALTADWNMGTNKVGIGVAPSYVLDVALTSDNDAVRMVNNELTVQGTHTAARKDYGLYVYTGSTANRNGHNSFIYAARLKVEVLSGDMYRAIGAQMLASNFSNSPNMTMYGNYCQSANRGTLNNFYGFLGIVLADAAGSASQGVGVLGQVQVSHASATITTGRCFYASAIQSVGTLTTNYLYYGLYSGTFGTKWGVYLTGETKNYFSGRVGIGVDPSYPLHLSYSPGDQDATGALISFNPSGTGTAVRDYKGLNVDIASTHDDNGNTTGIIGINTSVVDTGDTHALTGIYALSEHNNVNTCGQIAGANLRAHVTSGTVSNTFASIHKAVFQGGAGSGTAVRAEVTQQGAGTTVTNAYGQFSKITQTAGTITNGYLFYGLYVGTVGTKWGIYLTGETKNYFSGDVGIGNSSPTAKLDVNSNILRLRTAKTPASAGAAGNAGDICWDSGHVYVCTATNTWKRAAIATW